MDMTLEQLDKNKSINKIKLAITTKCNLACDYCFVKKTNQDMHWDTAKNAVHLLLESKGKDKLLSLYGGEPLLNFKLIEKICPYAVSRAKILKKNLIISVCTNATLLKERHLDFFKEYGVRLIISLVGKKSDHDNFRSFVANAPQDKIRKGSYKIISEKLPLVFKKIPLKHLGVSFCLLPSTVERIEKNFKHLIKLGFNNINFEVIHYYQDWSKSSEDLFESGFNKITKLVLNNIPRRNFVFLNPVNWEIKYQKISRSFKGECPLWYRLEVYPSGVMAFSPFLLNSPDKKRYIIGNVSQGFSEKLKECQYNSKYTHCQRCLFDYFSSTPRDKGAEKIYGIYRSSCLSLARKIESRALKNKMYIQYIKKIKNEICF